MFDNGDQDIEVLARLWGLPRHWMYIWAGRSLMGLKFWTFLKAANIRRFFLELKAIDLHNFLKSVAIGRVVWFVYREKIRRDGRFAYYAGLKDLTKI